MGRLRDILPEERPAEKARRLDIADLGDQEPLALLLRSDCSGQDITELFALIPDLEPRHEGLLGLLHNSMQDYMQVCGVDEAKVLQLITIDELSKCIWWREAVEDLTAAFANPSICTRYYMEALCHLEQEELHAAFLDTKLRLTCDHLLSRGSVNSPVVSAREFAIVALRVRAVRMTLIHNHPSGDLHPSRDDQKVTAEIQEAVCSIDIPLGDHVVARDNAYYSFKEQGLL